MDTNNEKQEIKVVKPDYEEYVVFTSKKPKDSNYEDIGYTQSEWDKTPHLPKGLNVSSTDSNAEATPEEIDDSSELGAVELSLWEKFKALGMTSPTYGMKSLGGEFANFYALIRDEGDKKTFVVTAQNSRGLVETVEFNYFFIHEGFYSQFNIMRLTKHPEVVKLISRAERLCIWMLNSKSKAKGFLEALWNARESLPIRISNRSVTLQMVLGSILMYTSCTKEDYFYKEQGYIVIKSTDLYSVAEDMEVQPLEIVKVLNNAGMLVRSKVSNSYQTKKRINGVPCNVYTIKM